MLLQSVQNAFTEYSQRLRYLCVTYSPCKSMVFALQKYGFWRAKRGFLQGKSMVFVFWMLCCCNLFRMLSQSVRSEMAIRQQHFGNPFAMFWQSVRNILAIRQQCFGNPFVAFWQSVRNVLVIRQQHFGNPSAAVGVDLSCPHIRKHPRNGGRKCACVEMNIHI